MLAYGPGMPLAWIFGGCYFVTAIVTQRWALLRLHRLPELAFNDKVRARALGLSVCAYALCMCMCTVYVGCTALYIACACAVHCMCKVIKRMIKWVKYMLLLHLFAAYITFRPLPCTSLRELHATFLSWLRSQSWFLPLVAEDSPWLVAAAFRGAYAANTTAAADEPSAPSDAISMGALVTLLVLLVALSGILVVCICDCTCARLCAAQSRRLQALTHDVVRSQDVSRWARKVTQMQMHVSCMCACAFACVCTHTAHTLQHVHVHIRERRSPQEFAEMRALYQRKLQLTTELGSLQGLPPLSAALVGAEHPALRRMPKTGAFVHLNEVTPRLPNTVVLAVLTIHPPPQLGHVAARADPALPRRHRRRVCRRRPERAMV